MADFIKFQLTRVMSLVRLFVFRCGLSSVRYLLHLADIAAEEYDLGFGISNSSIFI